MLRNCSPPHPTFRRISGKQGCAPPRQPRVLATSTHLVALNSRRSPNQGSWVRAPEQQALALQAPALPRCIQHAPCGPEQQALEAVDFVLRDEARDKAQAARLVLDLGAQGMGLEERHHFRGFRCSGGVTSR